jgi:hypothetical protein
MCFDLIKFEYSLIGFWIDGLTLLLHMKIFLDLIKVEDAPTKFWIDGLTYVRPRPMV